MNELKSTQELEDLMMKNAKLGKFCKCKIPYPGTFFCRSCNRYFKTMWEKIK